MLLYNSMGVLCKAIFLVPLAPLKALGSLYASATEAPTREYPGGWRITARLARIQGFDIPLRVRIRSFM